MEKQRSKIIFSALVPAFLSPLTKLIYDMNDSQMLFGLSSEFWSGTLIGLTIVSSLVTAYLLITLLNSKRL